MTTQAKKPVVELDQHIKTLLIARVDPRNEYLPEEHKPFIAHRSTHPYQGRVLYAKLVYITRTQILNLSYKKMNELIIEDRKRKLILEGMPPVEALKTKGRVQSTLLRAEQNQGPKGIGHDVLSYLHLIFKDPIEGKTRALSRICDPRTGESMSLQDAQSLFQSILSEDDMKCIEEAVGKDDAPANPEYLSKCRDVNADVDRTLLYVQ